MNASLPRWFQLFLGVAEVAAAVGLTLPGLTHILPQLVPAAAAGVMVVMVSATIFHLGRGEISSAVITLLLLAMATFVAYMRWRVHRSEHGSPHNRVERGSPQGHVRAVDALRLRFMAAAARRCRRAVSAPPMAPR